MNLDVLNYGTRSHLTLWALIGVAWIVLGANSANVPWGTPNTWLVACTLVAGSAFGVAYRRTRSSMVVYFIAAAAIGGTRAIAYLDAGAGGPAWVWLIITLTNLVLLGHWTTTERDP